MTTAEEVMATALQLLAEKYLEDAHGEWPVPPEKAHKLAVEFIHKAKKQFIELTESTPKGNK